jgi:hypothetical protein
MRSVRISQQLPIPATVAFELFDSGSERTRASFLSLFFFFYSVFAASPLSCTKREEMDETGRGVKRRLVSYRESIGRRSRVRSSTITVTDDGLRMI